MKINKYIAISIILISTLVLSSCDSFLDEKPKAEKSTDQFWKSPADAKSAVNALYFGGASRLHNIDVDGGWTPKATMWGGIMSGLFVDKRKDRTFTNASEGSNFNIESFDNTALKLWEEFYLGVSRANSVIEKMPTMKGVIADEQIDYNIAQAKFFRAYNYFYLVKEFGGVPYIDKPYEEASKEMFVPRSSAADVYKNIELDLLDIINGEDLPNVSFYSNKGLVTLSMAQTLLAQVYLQWAGAPVNGGNEYYTKAAQMAKNVIGGGQHALIQPEGSTTDTQSAFNIIKTTKISNEIIYAKEYNQTAHNIGNSYASRSIENEATQWADAEGNKLFKPGGDVMYNAYLPADILINSYLPTDVRVLEKQFFFKKYENFTLNRLGNWAWFDSEALANGRSGDYNMPIFRYAEVLLIAAEGLARTGKDTEAQGYLNQVRKRAGVADATETGDKLAQVILTERFHEFPLEFKIWDDIRRTRLYPEADGANSGTLKWTALTAATIQNKPDGFVKVGAIPEHALLWPIPLSEMQANPALKGHQNPGWN